MATDMTTGEVLSASNDLILARDPEQVLEEAMRAAKALKRVIDGKEKPVKFNGETYLEFEDWQTCARFFGITAKVVSTTLIEMPDGTRGYEAHAVAIYVPTGQEVSAADAMCLNDEDKWRSRAKYEWRNGPEGRERVKVGDEPVPLFQLRSMAQTRACAKALRNVVSWVVVLAGYRPTPAEEMPDEARDRETKPTNGHTSAPQRKEGAAPRVISEAQDKRLWAIAKNAGWQDDELKKFLKEQYGFEHSADITRDKYDAVCAAVQAGGQS
jgi:hypothetical protein